MLKGGQKRFDPNSHSMSNDCKYDHQSFVSFS